MGPSCFLMLPPQHQHHMPELAHTLAMAPPPPMGMPAGALRLSSTHAWLQSQASGEMNSMWDRDILIVHCRNGVGEVLRGPGEPSSSGRGLRVELKDVTFGCAVCSLSAMRLTCMAKAVRKTKLLPAGTDTSQGGLC